MPPVLRLCTQLTLLFVVIVVVFFFFLFSLFLFFPLFPFYSFFSLAVRLVATSQLRVYALRTKQNVRVLRPADTAGPRLRYQLCGREGGRGKLSLDMVTAAEPTDQHNRLWLGQGEFTEHVNGAREKYPTGDILSVHDLHTCN